MHLNWPIDFFVFCFEVPCELSRVLLNYNVLFFVFKVPCELSRVLLNYNVFLLNIYSQQIRSSRELWWRRRGWRMGKSCLHVRLIIFFNLPIYLESNFYPLFSFQTRRSQRQKPKLVISYACKIQTVCITITITISRSERFGLLEGHCRQSYSNNGRHSWLFGWLLQVLWTIWNNHVHELAWRFSVFFQLHMFDFSLNQFSTT